MIGLLQTPPDMTSQFLNENVITEGSCVYLGTDIIGMLAVFHIKVNIFSEKKHSR